MPNKSYFGKSLLPPEAFFLDKYLIGIIIYVSQYGIYNMKMQRTTINQGVDAREFSLQGTHATPANTVAAAAEYHAPALGHVLAGGMTDAHKRCAVGRGRDCMQPEASQAGRSGEVGK